MYAIASSPSSASPPQPTTIFWTTLAETLLLLGTACLNLVVLLDSRRLGGGKGRRASLACLFCLAFSVLAVGAAWLLWGLASYQWVELSVFAAEVGLCVAAVESMVLAGDSRAG